MQAHGILLIFIVIDAFAIWGEILIHMTDCKTDGAEHWNHTLHVISLSILWIMGLHILSTMITYQLLFFKNVFYIADMIIIGTPPTPSPSFPRTRTVLAKQR